MATRKSGLTLLLKCSLPWCLLPVHLSPKLFSVNGVDMAEILLILSYICAKEMLMCIPLLLIVGYLLKHYTDVPNGYIPYIETGMGLALGLIYGGVFVGGFNNVILYGGQGCVLGFISITIYDAVHGVVKHNCTSEVSMKEKKKINLWEHKAFVYTLAFLGGVLITALIKFITTGVEGLVYYLANEAIYSVLTLLLVDFLLKVSLDKTSITWQYWVMIGLMVLAVVSYGIASTMTTWTLVFTCLIIMAVFVAGSALICCKLYKPAVKKKVETVFEKATNDIIDMTSLSRSDAEEVVKYFIVK